jgi:hypothetical protein
MFILTYQSPVLLCTRGGVMFWADSLGTEYVYKRLDAWSKDYGEFFRPCEYLAVRARRGASLVSSVAWFIHIVGVALWSKIVPFILSFYWIVRRWHHLIMCPLKPAAGCRRCQTATLGGVPVSVWNSAPLSSPRRKTWRECWHFFDNWRECWLL